MLNTENSVRTEEKTTSLMAHAEKSDANSVRKATK